MLDFAETFARKLADSALARATSRKAAAFYARTMADHFAGLTETAVPNMRATHADDSAAWTRAVAILETEGPSPELAAAYLERKAARMSRAAVARVTPPPSGKHRQEAARDALEEARRDVARGWMRGPSTAGRLEHGSVIRSRTPQGERRTYVVAILPDDTMGAPWMEHDGHGIIRKTDCPTYRHGSKAPGEVLFSSDESGATYYAYDVPATIAKARAEGWGLGPDALAALERRAGRKPTRKMIVAEAVRLDLERCRGWVRDEWSWIGVVLVEVPRTGEIYPDRYADAARDGSYGVRHQIRASLWGIESDSPDYHASVALELVPEANAATAR